MRSGWIRRTSVSCSTRTRRTLETRPASTRIRGRAWPIGNGAPPCTTTTARARTGINERGFPDWPSRGARARRPPARAEPPDPAGRGSERDRAAPGADHGTAGPSARQGAAGNAASAQATRGETVMSRALWKGAISFGLVHVPVEIFSAEKRHELDFDMLDKRDLQPVGYQRINKKSGKVVPWEQIVKGYEHSKGKYVVLSDADFREANVEKTQTIDILSFVDIADIPVIYFDTPHYLVPARGGSKGYALLLQTLEKAKKAAVAQVVIRTRQRLAAVMPSDGMLVLCTLRYGYEIRPRDELEAPAEKKAAVSGREVDMALQLVKEMSEPFAPKKYKDTYR